MSIQTRSTATLVARLHELQQEEEEIRTELQHRAAEENERQEDDDELISLPEDGVSLPEDGVSLSEANEPVQPLGSSAPLPGGGMQPTRTRTIQGWRETAELSGLTFTTNQDKASPPHWQVADWPPLPFDTSPDHAIVTSVVVHQDPAADHNHNNKTSGTATVVVLSRQQNESNTTVHFLQVEIDTAMGDTTNQNAHWRIGPSMNQNERVFFAAVVCRGYLYAIGGIQRNSYPTEYYDTMERIHIQELLLGSSSNTNNPRGWTMLACRLWSKRCGCSAVVVQERFIVVAGGSNHEKKSLASIEILDTGVAASSANTSASGGVVVVLAGPPMTVGRAHFAMTVIGSRLYAVGGMGPEEELWSSVEYLELEDWVERQGPQRSSINSSSHKVSSIWTNSWRIHPQLVLDTPRSFFGMVRVGSCLVVVGGNNQEGNRLRSGQVLNTVDNVSWQLPEMIQERDGCTLVAHSTTGIVAIGGSDGGPVLLVAWLSGGPPLFEEKPQYLCLRRSHERVWQWRGLENLVGRLVQR